MPAGRSNPGPRSTPGTGSLTSALKPRVDELAEKFGYPRDKAYAQALQERAERYHEALVYIGHFASQPAYMETARTLHYDMSNPQRSTPRPPCAEECSAAIREMYAAACERAGPPLPDAHISHLPPLVKSGYARSTPRKDS